MENQCVSYIREEPINGLIRVVHTMSIDVGGVEVKVLYSLLKTVFKILFLIVLGVCSACINHQ
jgi:hypothetical protein